MTKTEAKRQATAVANELVENQRRLLKEAQRKAIPEGWWRHFRAHVRDALIAFRDVR